MELKDNSIYIVKDGKPILIEPPESGFGECTSIWKDGKIIDVRRSERVRV